MNVLFSSLFPSFPQYFICTVLHHHILRRQYPRKFEKFLTQCWQIYKLLFFFAFLSSRYRSLVILLPNWQSLVTSLWPHSKSYCMSSPCHSFKVSRRLFTIHNDYPSNVLFFTWQDAPFNLALLKIWSHPFIVVKVSCNLSLHSGHECFLQVPCHLSNCFKSLAFLL